MTLDKMLTQICIINVIYAVNRLFDMMIKKMSLFFATICNAVLGFSFHTSYINWGQCYTNVCLGKCIQLLYSDQCDQHWGFSWRLWSLRIDIYFGVVYSFFQFPSLSSLLISFAVSISLLTILGMSCFVTLLFHVRQDWNDR